MPKSIKIEIIFVTSVKRVSDKYQARTESCLITNHSHTSRKSNSAKYPDDIRTNSIFRT